MPCDYSKYPPNWKSEIRPAAMERAGHKCQICGLKNYAEILRGMWHGEPAFQDDNGYIYHSETGEKIGEDYLGEVDPTMKNKVVKVVLTVAHLNHDTTDNSAENLKVMCQYHHNRYDKEYRHGNRTATVDKKKGMQRLF